MQEHVLILSPGNSGRQAGNWAAGWQAKKELTICIQALKHATKSMTATTRQQAEREKVVADTKAQAEQEGLDDAGVAAAVEEALASLPAAGRRLVVKETIPAVAPITLGQ